MSDMSRPHAGTRLKRPDLRSETGVTLMEVLVASITSIVVGLALFATVDFAFRQTSSVAERVNANQRGRLAMEYVLTSLHSSCVAVSAVPILEKSKGEEMLLLSQTGEQAFFTSMTEHRIYLSGTSLIDASYESTGGTAPNWTFPALTTTPKSTKTIVTGVSQTGSTPLFRYYKYEGGKLSTTELVTPLSKEGAKTTAQVAIAFTVAPETTSIKSNVSRSIQVSDTALLRFDPASTIAQNTPCS
jgi:hypothetical protein